MQLTEKAEEHRYDAKLCSFLKNIIGGVFENVMPAPDLVVGSPCFCEGIGTILQDVAKHYDSRFFPKSLTKFYYSYKLFNNSKFWRKIKIVLF